MWPRRMRAFLLGLLAIVMSSSAGLPAGQPDEPGSSGSTYALAVQLRSEDVEGRSGGSAGSSPQLATTEFRTLTVGADPASCATSATSDSAVWERPALVWTIEARLVSVEHERATVDMRWRREASTPDVEPSGSFGVEQRLVLSTDRQTPLDLIRVARGSNERCGRFVLEASLLIVDPLEVSRAMFRYDLWLLHRDPDGRNTTERLRLAGRQGAALAYVFTSLRHRKDGTRVDRSESETLETEISGTVTGRARSNGGIDLYVQTWRSIMHEGGGIGAGGLKPLRVRSGETIEVELPPLTGGLQLYDLSKVYRGQSTAIRITVTRVR